MANLIGYLQGNRGEVSRTASHEITATLKTWQGSVSLWLHKDGSYTVHESDTPGGISKTVHTGKIDA